MSAYRVGPIHRMLRTRRDALHGKTREEPVGQGRGDGPELPPRGHDQLHFKHRPPRPGPEAWGRAFRARSTVYEEGIVRLWVRRTNRVLGRAPVDGYRRVALSACGEAAGPGSSWSAVQRARAATHASWARRCQAGLILYWKLNRRPPLRGQEDFRDQSAHRTPIVCSRTPANRPRHHGWTLRGDDRRQAIGSSRGSRLDRVLPLPAATAGVSPNSSSLSI